MDRNPSENTKKEILITGFGGQGIVLAGQVLGMAASLGDHKQSTLTQSYGPEARGGACSAQVIISDSAIHYPYVRRPDILVCLSQAGYDKYCHLLDENSVLLYDLDIVHCRAAAEGDSFAIPSTRMAEELGRKMMANIVMLGFCTAATGAVSRASMLKAILDLVPKGTEDANTAAFSKGHDFGLAVLKARRKKAAAAKGVEA
ncbi:MAG: 2-oxoacid:acceptor oxidoreductase family protein [Syntrophobacteraceae bacterium]